VTVDADAAPFVVQGCSVFAKFVTHCDGQVRPGDDVLVVDASGALLGVGRALLNPREMRDFAHGVAVDVKEGRDRTRNSAD
jgi:predicted RNA-binding protein (TIGR00451 family)